MTDSPAELDHWVTSLASALDLPDSEVPIGLLLDVTREAAHTVVRPAGPLTTYLVGVAVAQGMPLDAAVARARSAITEWGERISSDRVPPAES